MLPQKFKPGDVIVHKASGEKAVLIGYTTDGFRCQVSLYVEDLYCHTGGGSFVWTKDVEIAFGLLEEKK